MPIIYEEIIEMIPDKYKNLIYEQYFIDSPIFQQYANIYYSNIIFEGLGSWIADKAKKAKKRIKSGISKAADVTVKYTKKAIEVGKKAVNATKEAIGSTLKAISNSAANLISKGWQLVKKIGKAVWQGLKKLGEAVFGFAKKLYEIIQLGLKMIAGCKSGNKCGYSSPSDVPKDVKKAKDNVESIIPFMKSTVNGAAEAGKNTDTKKLEKAMAKGGDVNKELQQEIKKAGEATKNSMSSQLNGSAKAGAKQMNKDLQKTIPKKQLQQMHKDKDKYKPQISDELIFQSFENTLKYCQNNIKTYIIDLAYKGLTPKTIIQAKYNESFGETQGDIIIGQSVLSFKTNNGYLICEQKCGNNTIIYQTNTLYKGSHLIYQETSGTYFKPSIITEEQQEINQIISEQIDWLNVMLWGSLVLGILLILFVIFQVIAAIFHIVLPGSGFFVNIINAIINPFAGISAGISSAATAFGAAWTAGSVTGVAAATGSMVLAGAGAVGAATGAVATAKSGYEMAKQGYDAKLGDGIDMGNSDQISTLKQEVTNGPSDDQLINSFG